MGDSWHTEISDLHETLERLQIERLRLIGLLEEHLSPDLVTEILDGTQRLTLGGERHTVAVLFCDLRGFTRFTASEDPGIVVQHLNQFFHTMTTVLFAHRATVDKFIGDAILAYFKAGTEGPAEAARLAARAASQMQERFIALRGRWQLQGDLGLGIGLSLGEVILGHVGSGKHVDFTVVGTPVNLASRLCALAGSGEVLASAPFVQALESTESWNLLPSLTIKGFDETVQAYSSRRLEP